ncbi:hypothetical protein [Helicobacter cinaedi]|uniref:Class I SAM-dependent methyltransferase n=1 Tax=Helicobacter cinaedi TaxID=213 RepID=A0A377JMG0_9HELI|nr:hypothetical protein [Helicobacter cinaedi]STP08743.1 Uncharacterised protein [Helicobacter cinaedi]
MFDNFPKTRSPLPQAYQAIYEQHYKNNRDGQGAASGLAQKLERWLHYKVANDTQGISGHKTLEIGAGTLNQISYEKDFSHYDIIEPFEALYKDSPKLQHINAIYKDIAEVAQSSDINGGGANTNADKISAFAKSHIESTKSLKSTQKSQIQSPFYDRIISCAVLEHIANLPEVVAHSCLLLKDDGVFSAAIPSQARFLWTMAYKLSTGIEFRLKYKLDYDVIMNYKHINTQAEIIEICDYFFNSVKKSLFGVCDELSIYTHLSCRKPNRQRAKDYLASFKS